MEDCSYIKYEIGGISGINLEQDYACEVNDGSINNILISKGLQGITLYLQVNEINGAVKKECSDFVANYLLKLCIHPFIEVSNPSYNISLINSKSDNNSNLLIIKDRFSFEDKVFITRIYDKTWFEREVLNYNKLKLNKNTDIEYERLMSILKNQNQVTRYLLLYEQLLDLVSRDKRYREQKNVTNFIKKHKFNFEYSNIEFYKTRRENKDFREDQYTYYRNEISHADFGNDHEKYSNLTKDLTNTFINGIIEVINYAIYINTSQKSN